ncbi:UbiA prenyltransferase family protein [Empedobacter stercoris]|uniref:UbiA prenyltransferase family protein n=1 Tax=Empedobacter TaxID=59734 RepID=UPI0021AEC00D|nr:MULTISPECIES: UbiA prenyltransferase family protein [Empedobacter]MDM1521813.1 UbiA prenyltransferase family protein [Empedobacter sp. 225-1]MDM1541631.1 UbiA prenyltransferase family protein [Empedobacter sp. 189-2]UWX65711.1 UbiA prenyltransferase family protein [Empedobacter stercoris]
MTHYLKLMRVNQWVKNLFVFLPLFFSGNLFNIDLLIESFYGFLIFSFVASSIYIINDYVDIEKDKKHPEKKNRPLASGKISKQNAFILFLVLLVLTCFLLWTFGTLQVAILVGIYFLMNIAYSFKLKQVAILDVMIIAFGFLLRVFVGGYMTGILVSDWTILLVFDLALILALGKRRGELVNAELEGVTRKSLNGYNLNFLNSALAITCTVAVICYMMFILSPETQSKFHHYIIYTFVFVFAAVLRYLQQTFVYAKTESPTKLIFKDHFIQLLIVLWGISYVLLIYFNNGK